MDCVMKDQVQRKARNWSWAHMKEHRDLVRKYSAAWVEKQTNRSPSKDVDHTIEVRCHLHLFIFGLLYLLDLFSESGKGIGRFQSKRCSSAGGTNGERTCF